MQNYLKRLCKLVSVKYNFSESAKQPRESDLVCREYNIICIAMMKNVRQTKMETYCSSSTIFFPSHKIWFYIKTYRIKHRTYSRGDCADLLIPWLRNIDKSLKKEIMYSGMTHLNFTLVLDIAEGAFFFAVGWNENCFATELNQNPFLEFLSDRNQPELKKIKINNFTVRYWTKDEECPPQRQKDLYSITFNISLKGNVQVHFQQFCSFVPGFRNVY